MKDLGQARHSRRCQSEGATAWHGFEPAELQQSIQNSRSDESLEVITALAPVETRLAENSPCPRCQIDAEPSQETLTRRRYLAAFIIKDDVPHGHKRIGNSNSDPAGQVIVATSGKTQRVVVR